MEDRNIIKSKIDKAEKTMDYSDWRYFCLYLCVINTLFCISDVNRKVRNNLTM